MNLLGLALIATAALRRKRTSFRGLGFIEVEYDMPILDNRGHVFGTRRVTGIQVGRFAVRKSDPEEFYSLAKHTSRAWSVDHIPTGSVVITVDTMEQAFIVADDVSRFSKSDITLRGDNRMIDWLRDIHRNGYRMDYRAYWNRGQDLLKADEGMNGVRLHSRR